MGQRLGDRVVRALAAPALGNRILYDTECRGFGVRITAKGARSFVLNYRVNGQERRLTIGRWPEWSVGAAREEAQRRRRDIAVGVDPLRDRQAARQAPTMDDLCDDYLERHASSKRSVYDDVLKIRSVIRPRLGSRRVVDITGRDVGDIHRAMRGTPYHANRTLSLLSKMFNLAIQWGWRTDNPVKGINRYHEDRRQRYLSRAELGRLAKALSATKFQTSADVVRLLLLTGARRSEVFRMQWEQLDLDAGVWTKPAATTKANRTHRLLISPAAVEILTNRRRAMERGWARRRHGVARSPFVFPGRVPGEPLTDIKKFWAGICKEAALDGVRLHDLRHSFASILASKGFSLPVIGALLGHTQVSTTQRYAHLFDDPLKAATGEVAAVFSEAARDTKAPSATGDEGQPQ